VCDTATVAQSSDNTPYSVLAPVLKHGFRYRMLHWLECVQFDFVCVHVRIWLLVGRHILMQYTAKVRG